MQALYSDQHRDLHDGYGLKYETAANHPHLFIAFSPWRGARRALRADGGAVEHRSPSGVLLRDRDGGEVRVGRDGEPVVRYKLSAFDTEHVSHRDRRGGPDPRGGRRAADLRLAGQMGVLRARAAAGREAFMARRRFRRVRRPGGLMLGSFHIMGSARMGGSPATSACDPTRADLGRAGSVRARRLVVPDRIRRQSPDLDPGDRPHGRARACGALPDLERSAAGHRARSAAKVGLREQASSVLSVSTTPGAASIDDCWNPRARDGDRRRRRRDRLARRFQGESGRRGDSARNRYEEPRGPFTIGARARLSALDRARSLP